MSVWIGLSILAMVFLAAVLLMVAGYLNGDEP
jgi:hypothetical protein